MKPTLSLLVAALFLASAMSAAPAPEPTSPPAPKPAYDDGSWYPGKYPGDPTEKKKTGYGDHHDDGYKSDDHHDDGYKSDDHHDDGYKSDDHHGDDGYKATDHHENAYPQYPHGSPYDYAPHGRARSYSRSRERVNQWHDVNADGYSRSYTRNWHGQGQYYLQRRGVEEEKPRGRTLVRRGEEETPVLKKRGQSWDDGYYYPHHYDHHNGPIRPLRPLRPLAPIGGDYYHRFYKRSLDADTKPALEKRSGYDHHSDSDSDHKHHGKHHHGHRRHRRRHPRPYRHWNNWNDWNNHYYH